jgi:SAM-dependent methyltransferase
MPCHAQCDGADVHAASESKDEIVTLRLKRWIKNAYWVSILYYLLSDVIARLRFLTGDIGTASGTLHSQLSETESVQYVEEVFNDYREYAGVSHFYGRVAEVGPGDNCGVGMLFRVDGSEWVDLVDRFYSRRNEAAQGAIYEALLAKHASLKILLGDADLRDERSFKLLKRHYGVGAAAENYFRANKGYDFIVSRAVFEHLYDPMLALKHMALALNPGGYLLHKIDLRDHGMFSGGFHELKFLEIPALLYPWMTAGNGRPNRVMIQEYRSAMQALKLDGELLVTRLAGVGEISPHLPYESIAAGLRADSIAYVKSVRHRFAACFSAVSDEDLSVAGVFLVARKHGA